jgi:hypothetical protein
MSAAAGVIEVIDPVITTLLMPVVLFTDSKIPTVPFTAGIEESVEPESRCDYQVSEVNRFQKGSHVSQLIAEE